MPWILQRQEKGCYSNLLTDLIHTDIPEYQNFVRMPPGFDLIEEHIHHRIKKSETNFRKPLEVGLAIMLRHLTTGIPTPPCSITGWLAEPPSANSFPRSAEPSFAKFQDEYLHCSTSPDEWKREEEKFRTRWNVPHAEGALDGKIITMKRPKKSHSDYYNYKGFFFLVLALVYTGYRFLWIDCGSSESSSDAQIFNRSDLREKIKDGSLGLPAPEPLGGGGGRFADLGDDAFVLMPWMVKPYSRRQLTREERIANYRISRGRRVVENTFRILVSWFRVLLGTMEQRQRVVKDIVFTCVVLHNMVRTHQGRADRAPTPGNDVRPYKINRQCMCLMRTIGILQGRSNINENY